MDTWNNWNEKFEMLFDDIVNGGRIMKICLTTGRAHSINNVAPTNLANIEQEWSLI
jgi:hypothetical protein